MLLAEEREDFRRHMDLLDIQKVLAVHQFDGEVLQKKLVVLSNYSRELVQKEANLMDYETIWNRIVGFRKAASADLTVEVAEIQSDPFVRNERFQSLKAEILYTKIHQWIARRTDDISSAAAHNMRLVELMEAKPSILKDSKMLLQYFDAIFAWGMCLIWLKRFDEVSSPIKKYDEASNLPTQFSPSLVWGRKNTLTRSLHEGLKDWSKIEELIKEIESTMPEFGQIPIHETMGLIYMMASLLIKLGHYKRALHWFESLLQIYSKAREDLVAASRVLILICYYSLESLDTLHRELSLNKKRAQKNQYNHHFSFIIDFFKEAVNLPLSDRKKLEAKFKVKVEGGKYSEYAKIYFDWSGWINSIVSGATISQLDR